MGDKHNHPLTQDEVWAAWQALRAMFIVISPTAPVDADHRAAWIALRRHVYHQFGTTGPHIELLDALFTSDRQPLTLTTLIEHRANATDENCLREYFCDICLSLLDMLDPALRQVFQRTC